MPDVSSPVDPYRGNIDVGVVSVDLAYKDYRNVGIAVLTDAPDGISCEFVQLSIGGEPFPGDLARALVNLWQEKQEKGRWFKCNLTGMEKASRMKTYVETSETRHSRCFTSCDGARD
jgi:hypothetical protein